MGVRGKELKVLFLSNKATADVITFGAAGPTVLAHRFRVPCAGRVVGARAVATTATTLGTATNLLETITLINNGPGGAGNTPVSGAARFLDQIAVRVPVAGQITKIQGLAANRCFAGDQLTFSTLETGTPGTVTRSNLFLTDIEFEPEMNSNIDNPV